MYLHHPATEGVTVGAPAAICDGDILPPNRVGKRELCKLNKIMVASAGIEDYVGRRVRLVLIVVDIKANRTNLDTAQEMDCKLVWLLAIGPVVPQ